MVPTSETPAHQDPRVEMFERAIEPEPAPETTVSPKEAALLAAFQRGRLTHDVYTKLPTSMQKLYKRLHGYRPMSEAEIRGENRKAKARKAAQKRAKQVRKVNRAR